MAVPFSQHAFTGGEVSPDMRLRADVKTTYTALTKALNIVPVPQGGFRLRGGLCLMGRRRKQLAPVVLTDAMITANVALTAGVLANLTDGNAATFATFTGQAGPATLLTIDLGAPASLVAIDWQNLQIVTGGTGAALDGLVVETSLNATVWTLLGARDIRASAQTRRVAVQPGDVRQARFIRLRLAAASGNVQIGGLSLWTETTTASPVLMVRQQTETRSYLMVFTDRHADIWRDDRIWIGSASIPHTAAQIAAMTTAHSLDTAVLFHPDVQTCRLQRRGGDGEWHFETITFTNIPTEKFDGVTAEPLMSTARGWPSCGCFYQQRLFMGGFRSLPFIVLASLLSDVFNLDTSGTLATNAIRFDLEGDEYGVPQVRRLKAGQRLEVYTQMGLFYGSETVVAKGGNFGFVLADRVGIRSAARVVDTDRQSYLVQSEGSIIRKLVYDDSLSNRYSTEPVSVMSAHLTAGAIDLTRRQASDVQSADLIHIVTDAGGWRVMQVLPSQEISGFLDMAVDGTVRGIGPLTDRDVALAIDWNGGEWVCIHDDACQFDFSVMRAAGPSLAALTHLNGRTDVHVAGGGRLYGPFEVTNGAIQDHDVPDGLMVEVGVPFAWRCDQMRLFGDSQRQIAMNRIIAVSVVQLELDRSGPFDMAVDDGPWRTVDPVTYALPMDGAGDDLLFTGTVIEDGFFGLGDGIVRLRGTSAWPFRCLSILREANW